jgi:uncharacterized protein (TIGR03435 family)
MRVIAGWIPAIFLSLAAFGQTAPPKAEFEVASIRPSGPLMTGDRLNIGVHVDGAQVRCTSLSLKDYIRIAYRIKDYQVTGPDWMASERFDISAKLPAGASREQVPEMLQTLLTERFQLKMHHDKKEFSVYALVVAKGGAKLKESVFNADESAEAAKAVNVTASGGRGGTVIDLGKGASFSWGNNRLEAKKLTMTAFADTLARFVDRPVVDMTDLKGTYDLELELSPEDFRAMSIRSAIAAGVTLPPEAMRLLENAGDDSLFAALQLVGLKLEPRKAPLEVLVIDHAEKNPTEN